MSDPIFQRGLQDLIKGIRSHKKDPSAFISQAMASIKTELRSTDPFLKTEAIRKLTYLQMIGYNVSWAAFSIVEVMSQTRFAHKRVGYLAANQSFTESTDVILLTTNLFKKEFSSSSNNQYEIGMAINCLANIATKDLARDCISDLVVLMNHSRAYVRKKAVLAMFKLYVKFPQGLRLTFDKLKDRLDDSESSVISTAVNVICELANKNPRNYLAMAPKFFRLLTTSSNNWMLIKVVKLLGSLVSEEPRLARKLLEPLSTIIQNTGAKSLQYECIHTVTLALPYTKREDGSDSKNAPAVVKLCSDYLRGFIEDPDQNLKYLGLVGLVNLMKSNPRSVCDHREIVLRCLTDDDITIRTRALELLAGIVSRKSLVDLVHHLLQHVKHSEGSYRDEIIAKVLYMCSKEKFGLVTDFAWYASVLLDLAVMPGSKHGQEVADQLIEIALRVDTVRPYAVESMLSMLLTDTLILGQARQTVSEVLKAAAWIVGEYSEIVSLISHDIADDGNTPGGTDCGYWIEGPTGEDIRSSWRGQPIHVLVVDALLHPRATNLPPHVQSAYIQSAMKVFVRACSDCTEGEIASLVGIARNRLGVFLQSVSSEVQERASTLRHLLSEMEILPMNWEVQAEEVKPSDKPLGGKGKKGEKAATKEMNLLEVDDLLDLPEYTVQSVKAVDDQGAAVAKRKARMLAAAVGEVFYAVHSKAQKRVPVPEGLDLDVPFNASATAKLLALQMPENLTLATLAFAIALPMPPMEQHYDNHTNDEEARLAKVMGSTFPPEEKIATGPGSGAPYPLVFGGSEPNSKMYPPYLESSSASSNPTGRSAEDNLFYLTPASRALDILPLSQTLSDAFTDKKSKKVKGSKKEKRKKTDFNMRDMLPAGAVSSDDEKGYSRKDKKSSSTRKKGEGVDLDSVDITTPLRADEVFTVQKHREVPVNVSSLLDVGDKVEEEGKKKKSSKKTTKYVDEDDKKSKKDKTKSKKGKPEPSNDLLMMDWNDPPMPSIPAPVQRAAPVEIVDKKDKGKSSTKKASHVWLPLMSDKNVDLYYSTSVSSNVVTITLKAVNSSKTGSSVSVTATFSSSASARPSTPSNSNLRVAQQLGSGGDCTAATEMVLLGDAGQCLTGSLQIGCTAHVTVDSLLGPETKATAAVVKVPVCCSFSPNKLDEEAFTALMGKSSSRWASCSVKLACSSGKPKSALKAVGTYLRAHTIEAESSKAASLSSKSASGGTVCCLAKVSKDGTTVSVDIKCLCASKAESQSLAAAISEALGDLSL